MSGILFFIFASCEPLKSLSFVISYLDYHIKNIYSKIFEVMKLIKLDSLRKARLNTSFCGESVTKLKLKKHFHTHKDLQDSLLIFCIRFLLCLNIFFKYVTFCCISVAQYKRVDVYFEHYYLHTY